MLLCFSGSLLNWLYMDCWQCCCSVSVGPYWTGCTWTADSAVVLFQWVPIELVVHGLLTVLLFCFSGSLLNWLYMDCWQCCCSVSVGPYWTGCTWTADSAVVLFQWVPIELVVHGLLTVLLFCFSGSLLNWLYMDCWQCCCSVSVGPYWTGCTWTADSAVVLFQWVPIELVVHGLLTVLLFCFSGSLLNWLYMDCWQCCCSVSVGPYWTGCTWTADSAVVLFQWVPIELVVHGLLTVLLFCFSGSLLNWLYMDCWQCCCSVSVGPYWTGCTWTADSAVVLFQWVPIELVVHGLLTVLLFCFSGSLLNWLYMDCWQCCCSVSVGPYWTGCTWTADSAVALFQWVPIELVVHGLLTVLLFCFSGSLLNWLYMDCWQCCCSVSVGPYWTGCTWTADSAVVLFQWVPIELVVHGLLTVLLFCFSGSLLNWLYMDCWQCCCSVSVGPYWTGCTWTADSAVVLFQWVPIELVVHGLLTVLLFCFSGSLLNWLYMDCWQCCCSVSVGPYWTGCTWTADSAVALFQWVPIELVVHGLLTVLLLCFSGSLLNWLYMDCWQCCCSVSVGPYWTGCTWTADRAVVLFQWVRIELVVHGLLTVLLLCFSGSLLNWLYMDCWQCCCSVSVGPYWTGCTWTADSAVALFQWVPIELVVHGLLTVLLLCFSGSLLNWLYMDCWQCCCSVSVGPYWTGCTWTADSAVALFQWVRIELVVHGLLTVLLFCFSGSLLNWLYMDCWQCCCSVSVGPYWTGCTWTADSAVVLFQWVPIELVVHGLLTVLLLCFSGSLLNWLYMDCWQCCCSVSVGPYWTGCTWTADSAVALFQWVRIELVVHGLLTVLLFCFSGSLLNWLYMDCWQCCCSVSVGPYWTGCTWTADSAVALFQWVPIELVVHGLLTVLLLCFSGSLLNWLYMDCWQCCCSVSVGPYWTGCTWTADSAVVLFQWVRIELVVHGLLTVLLLCFSGSLLNWLYMDCWQCCCSVSVGPYWTGCTWTADSAVALFQWVPIELVVHGLLTVLLLCFSGSLLNWLYMDCWQCCCSVSVGPYWTGCTWTADSAVALFQWVPIELVVHGLLTVLLLCFSGSLLNWLYMDCWQCCCSALSTGISSFLMCRWWHGRATGKYRSQTLKANI